MSNPARAGTHPPKVHFNGHPLSDKHRRATRMSSMTIHPQQSKAHLVNLGTKQHKSGNCSGSSSASPWVHPIPVPINHFWQVVGKQLLMIVLLWSAGSHLLTLPAVVCLPEPWQKDRCGQHASRQEDLVKTQQGTCPGPIPAKHHPQKHVLALHGSRCPFSNSLMPVLSFYTFTLKMQRSISKTTLSLPLLRWGHPTFCPSAIQAPLALWNKEGIYNTTNTCMHVWGGLRLELSK